jgi:hypothetical protein
MTHDAYQTVCADTYGCNLGDGEIDAVPHLKRNAGTYNHARFGAIIAAIC